MFRPLAIAALGAALTVPVLRCEAQIPFNPDHSRIFQSDGKPASLESILASAESADVIFVGESHDDAAGHALQAEIFRRIHEKYGAKRKIALSLEMFESDVQIVVNEYLADQISERHFLSSSRPWANYATDYKPLVEFAKAQKLPVIAANAPRRYVNMVSRLGRNSLNGLSPQAKSWLPPLPYAAPSPAYAAKFNALMNATPQANTGLRNMLDSQTLWDASMGYAAAQFLKANPTGLVVHLNGRFHTEKRLGTVEHLLQYQPGTKAVVVTMQYDDSFPTFTPAKHEGLGDFVVLTDPKLPRSSRGN